MCPDTKSKISQDEMDDLSIGLLTQWCITSVQAFVGSSTSDVALRYLRPHAINAGRAAAHIFPPLTGIKNPFEQMKAAGRSMEKLLMGRFEADMDPTDGAIHKKFFHCATEGKSKEFCLFLCDFVICSRWTEALPSTEWQLIKCLGNGDAICEWKVLRKNAMISDEMVLGYCNYYKVRPPDILDPITTNALNHEYMGEFWTIVTRAFIEESGPNKALEVLAYNMRLLGISQGIQLSKKLKIEDIGLQAIGDVVSLVNDLHRRQWTLGQGEDFIEGTVHHCPFVQTALPEMCHQYCAFFNGVCEVIDPSYEFVYDRMMTKGDPTCHWIIRKKASRIEGTKTTEDNDVLKRLASRYVMGEISKQEYEELKAILR